MDLAVAFVGLCVTAPVWAAVAVAIRLTSGPGILHRGDRLGKNGRIFGMYKFRTMAIGSHLAGSRVTGANDPRVTPVGRLLRRWKLDELPQLVNVVRGDMSLVGPRPEDPRYLPDYAPNQMEVLSVRPGITGPTQIAYRHEEALLRGPDVEGDYRTKLLPAKLDMDLSYIRTASLSTDVRLILATLIGLYTPTLPPGITSTG
ncbi:MAG TPA: sugar transferase [Chloroflexota bacterium]|nr:sugar transferase [Chloroflexota bacterium]